MGDKRRGSGDRPRWRRPPLLALSNKLPFLELKRQRQALSEHFRYSFGQNHLLTLDVSTCDASKLSSTSVNQSESMKVDFDRFYNLDSGV